jgi:hypothetical protein
MIIFNFLPFIVIIGYLIYDKFSCKYSDDLMERYVQLQMVKSGKVLRDGNIITRTTTWSRNHGS